MALPRPRQVFVLLLAVAVVTSTLISSADAESNETTMTVGGYTLYRNKTVVDASGTVVPLTKNEDGSESFGEYTSYSNDTIVGPNGVIVSKGPDDSLIFGSTIMYNMFNFTDLSGKALPLVRNSDGSATVGDDMTLWSNGTIATKKDGIIINTGSPIDLSGKAASPDSKASKAASPVKPGYIVSAITMAAGFAFLLA